MCSKDTCLFFFDAIDGFQAENKFDIHAFTKDIQTSIWFVEFIGFWLTADAKCCLNFWNIADQRLEKRIVLRRAGAEQPKVLDLRAIDPLKLLVVATSDKVLSVYETQGLKNLLNLSMEQGGFNTMEYFESYQVLLVAGFENTVKVFSITPEHYELNAVGRLVGHVSIVNAVAVVEGTAMALSCDDRCVVKVWDVRKLSCIQTIQLASKSNICLMAYLPGRDRMLFAGERLSSMDFEDNSSHTLQKEAPAAQACELNEVNNELFVVLRSEIRVLDFATGRVKCVYVNLVDRDREDSICAFKLVQKKNLFILGDANGAVNLYNATSGDLLKRSRPHANSVSAIRLDNLNDMIVTCAADTCIKVQLEKDPGLPTEHRDLDSEARDFFKKPMLLEGYGHTEFEKYKREVLGLVQASAATDLGAGRRPPGTRDTKVEAVAAEDSITLVRGIEGCNGNLEVGLMEVCIYHNIVAASSADSFVYLYNYEFIRPIGKVELEAGSEATSLLFLTGYAKLLIGTSAGSLFIVSWQFESPTNLRLRLEMALPLSFFRLPLSADGFKTAPLTGHANKMIVDLALGDAPEGQAPVQRTDTVNNSKYKMRDKPMTLVCADLLIAESTGVVCRCDLRHFLEREKTFDNFAVSSNYNPFRSLSEDFENSSVTLTSSLLSVAKETPRRRYEDVKGLQNKVFRVARSALTCLEILKLSQKLILLASTDSTVRVFTLGGEMLCHTNLNHPLPIKWDLREDSLSNLRGSVLFALKTVEVMNQRYPESDYKKLITVNDILEAYESPPAAGLFQMTSICLETRPARAHKPTSSSAASSPRELHEQSLAQMSRLPNPVDTKQGMMKKNTILLMKDLYSPKDLAYDRIKELNRDEIQGPTLKQLDSIRRANNVLSFKDPVEDREAGKPAEKHPTVKKSDFANAGYFGRLKSNPAKDMDDRESLQHSIAGKLEAQMSLLDNQSSRLSTKRLDAGLQSPRTSRAGQQGSRLPVLAPKGKAPQAANKSASRHSPQPSKREAKQGLSERALRPLPRLNLHGASFAKHAASDLFEYATERHLLHDSETRRSDQSRLLNELASRSKISVTQETIDKKVSKMMFHDLLRNLDKKKTKARARLPLRLALAPELATEENSAFAAEAPAEHDSSKAPSDFRDVSALSAAKGRPPF